MLEGLNTTSDYSLEGGANIGDNTTHGVEDGDTYYVRFALARWIMPAIC